MRRCGWQRLAEQRAFSCSPACLARSGGNGAAHEGLQTLQMQMATEGLSDGPCILEGPAEGDPAH